MRAPVRFIVAAALAATLGACSAPTTTPSPPPTPVPTTAAKAPLVIAINPDAATTPLSAPLGANAVPVSDSAAARSAVQAGIDAGLYPGAAYATGIRDQVGARGAVGSLGYDGEPAPTPDGTLYDLASVTKSVTAIGAMILVGDGKMALADPVAKYLPAYASGSKAGVTIEMLLAHTAGLPDYAPSDAFDGAEGDPGRVRAIIEGLPLDAGVKPGTRYLYSSVGYAVLWDAMGVAGGMPPERLLQERLFDPLGMTSATFDPADVARVAPNTSDRGTPITAGLNQDRIARYLHGLAGEAGLFATADDLGHLMAMLASGGSYGGRQVVSPELIAAWSAPTASSGGRYGLGFRSNAGGSHLAGEFSAQAFGHTGWTGGAMFVDPATGAWAVLVTNRTYAPTGHVLPPNQLDRIYDVFRGLTATVVP